VDNACKNCRHTNNEGVNFCTKCGHRLKKSEKALAKDSITKIIFFYVVFLVFSFVSYTLYEASDSFSNLGLELAIEAAFAAIVLGFCFLDYKSILRIYQLPIRNWRITTFSFVFPIISAVVVYYSLEFFNDHLFQLDMENVYFGYSFLDHPVFWSVFFMAILPPIFEELAFRGFLFNEMIKITSARITIVATAFIFALVHFSFISFIWIFPFGIVLGVLRHKYRTLWYGMLVHFIHNLLVLLLDIYYFNIF